MGISRLLTIAIFLASAASSPITSDASNGPSLHLVADSVVSTTNNDPDAGHAAGLEEPIIPLVNTDPIDQTSQIPEEAANGIPPSLNARDRVDPPDSSSSLPSEPAPVDSMLHFRLGSPVKPSTRRDAGEQHYFGESQAIKPEQSRWQDNVAGSCVYTISEAPPVSPCSSNGVETVYPATTTAYKQVDCNGCVEVFIRREKYHCQKQDPVNATQQVDYPSTYWSTVCLPSTTLAPHSTPASTSTGGADGTRPTPSRPKPGTGETRPFTTHMPIPTSLMHPGKTPTPTTTQMPMPPEVADPESPQNIAVKPRVPKVVGKNGMLCPTTYIIQPPKTAGAIWTHFLQTLTTTACIPCAGCPLVTSTALMGYGPAGRFKTTVTVPMGTTTVYKCA